MIRLHTTGVAGRHAVALVLVALAGCGGSNNGASPRVSVASLPPTSAPLAPALQSAVVRVFVPASAVAAASSSTRTPRYVSPGTNGSLITVTANGTTVFTAGADLSAGSTNCVANGGGGRTCTIPLSLPAGTFSFALATYDAILTSTAVPQGAHQLAQASLTQTIIADAANVVNFALAGLVSSVTGNIGSGAGTALYGSLPNNGALTSVGISVAAEDASGNVISGSNPYASPIAVTLAETVNGSAATGVVVGTSQLLRNGVAAGTSTQLTSPSDVLAVQFHGSAPAGYSTLTTIGGGATVRLSPLVITPSTDTSTNLMQAFNGIVLSEYGAPASIAYSGTQSTNTAFCNTDVSSLSVAGTGASGVLNYGTTAAAGATGTCTLLAMDNLGTATPFTAAFSVSGTITVGTPTFPSGGASGDCSTAIGFSGTGLTAQVAWSPTSNYFTGETFAVATSNAAVATASVTPVGQGATSVITAAGIGTANITFTDSGGGSSVCTVNVTTTTGGVQ